MTARYQVMSFHKLLCSNMFEGQLKFVILTTKLRQLIVQLQNLWATVSNINAHYLSKQEISTGEQYKIPSLVMCKFLDLALDST